LGKLEADRDSAYRSRMLAEILVDIPLPQDPRLPLGAVNAEALAESLEELELFSLRRQVNQFAQVFSAEPPASLVDPESGGREAPGRSPKADIHGYPDPDSAAGTASTAAPSAAGSPSAQPSSLDAAPPELQPELITSPEALAALMQRLLACTDAAAPVALDTETTSLNPFRAELVGVGVAWGEGPAELAYIPIGHRVGSSGETPDLLSPPPAQLPLDQVLTALAPWLGSAQHPKALQNAKYDRLILLRHGLPLEGVVMDTLLADYLRDANAKHGLELLAQRNFGFLPTSYSELVPKGADFSAVPIEQAALYCGMDVHVTRRLAPLLRAQLEELGPQLPQLLDRVELPLEPVLALMEATGIRIDTSYLAELSSELGQTLQRLEADAKA
ncbi:MAG: DNA polymerase I, partial [Vulcanococcus sp.]